MRRSRLRSALIVVAALAILVPVTAYALRHAHEVSMQQTCASNLKTLGEACSMYQEDWHDVLVPYGGPSNYWYRASWPDLVLPYIRQMRPHATAKPGGLGRTLLCPVEYHLGENVVDDISYGINSQCGGWMAKEKPVVVSLKSVKYPARTIRFAEVKWHAQGGSLFAAMPSQFVPSDRLCHMFAAWHQGKGNVLWIDGHVSAMTQEQYNMRDKGPYDGNIWLRLEGPKPPVPGRRM